MRSLSILIVLSLLLIPLGAGQAQAPQTDALLIRVGNSIYLTSEGSFSAEPVILNGCGGNNSKVGTVPISVAPDGRFLAYEAYPAGFEALLQQGWGGPTPSEIYLCDFQTQNEIKIYSQPTDYSVSGDTVSYEILSGVSWSPDGNALAFSSLSTSSSTPRLHVYDVNTGTTSIVNDNLPALAGSPRPPEVSWGNTGIVSITNTFANDEAIHLLLVHGRDGNEIARAEVNAVAQNGAPVEYFTAMRGSEELVIIPYISGDIEFFNLSTNQFEAATGVIQYSVANSGLRLNYLPNGGVQGASWEVQQPDDSRTLLPFTDLASSGRIGISLSANSIAFITDALYIWSNQQIAGTVALPSTDPSTLATARLQWAPGTWQVVAGGYG